MDIKTADTPTPSQDSTVSSPPAAPNDEKRAGHALLWKGAQLGIGKVLNLLATLVLGRLLTPYDFGLVAIASIATTTVMTATETGMTSALVQATNREKEHYDVVWTIGLLRGLAVLSLLYLGAPYAAELFGDARATSLVRLMALLPLLNSINSPRMTDLIRELQFSRIATVAILAVVVEVTVSITLASSLGGKAIILGKVCGGATTAIASYIVAPYKPRFRSSYASARQLIAFGRWLFGISLMAVLSNFLINVVVARQLTVTGLGRFNWGDRLAEAPTQMSQESIGAVAFPLYARLRADPSRLETAVKAHLIGLMFLLFMASGLLIGLAYPIEHRVLADPRWVGTASILILLVIGYACEVSWSVVYYLLQALGWGSRLFAAELAQYLVLIVSVAALAKPYGLTGIGAARIITAVVVAFAGYKAAPPMFGTILRRTLRTTVVLLLIAALGGTVAWFGALIVPGATGLGVGALLGAVSYVLLVWLVDRPCQLGVRRALSLFFPTLSEKGARTA
jgi:O-antigen/teichoic acid export membrane protein